MGTTNGIVQQLEATKKEIEQFLSELNFENVAAEERYEKLKDELRVTVKEMRASLEGKDIISENVASALQLKLSALEGELGKPKRNAADDIKLFLRGIKNTIKEITRTLDKENSFNEVLEKIHDQLQRYKLKFEIIKLKLELGKLEVKYTGKEVQHQLSEKINAPTKFVSEGEREVTGKLKRFRHAVTKIYSDFSKIYS